MVPTGDGTWEPYPTCAGDLRETQDGCDGCPGPFGDKRNRTAESILGKSVIKYFYDSSFLNQICQFFARI